MNVFRRLQQELGPAYALNTPDSSTSHVVVLLPSFSVGESLLSHYAGRLPSLEHRFLVGLLSLRMPATRVVYICSVKPASDVVEHYLSLLPLPLRPRARDRFQIVVVDDVTARPVAAKLLDRPDLIDRIRSWIGRDPGFIEPWNVAEPERELALRLGLPLMGTAPELWPMGFKSAGRKLFRDAGIPVPPGYEDLSSVTEVVDAIEKLRASDPNMGSVILKLDDSGAGDGNAVIRADDLEEPGSRIARRRLRSRVNSLEPWYLKDLESGCVAEMRMTGDRFSSPSAQVEIGPNGATRVLSTHEQILGGDDDQIYLGCRFPANPAYAPEIGAHAQAAAGALRERGALGRAAIDFVASSPRGGTWSVHAIEVNLRKGGTTHPYSVLRHLAPGRYDPGSGIYLDDSRHPKFYVASDNLVDETWTGIPEGAVLAALDEAGLTFDRNTRTGIVPYMLSGLAIDGRFGMAAIADSPGQADDLHRATIAAVQDRATGPARRLREELPAGTG
jgi:hypothetical protein